MINILISVKFKKQIQEDRSPERYRIAPRLRDARHRSVELLQTLLTVKLRSQKRSFLSTSHHQTTSRSPEIKNCGLNTKN